jgi:hypothetical protein
MQNWQAPKRFAMVSLYFVGARPIVTQLVIFEAHNGLMILNIHVNPSCGVVCPPCVMSNEATVNLQRPSS